jgi:transcriptional regulator
MYLPQAFAMDETDARSAIGTGGVALLVTHRPEDGFDAVTLPLMLRGNTLVGHVAKANPIWKRSGEVFVTFTPLDGYVSPSWYPSKQEHGRVVPTWNYITVHVHGTMQAHEDSQWIREVVSDLTDLHEHRIGSGWKLSDAPPDFVESQLRAIVGVEIAIQRIEGKAKLSQNRPPADVEGVIASAPAPMGSAVREWSTRRGQ